MSLSADTTIRELMGRGATSICGRVIEFKVDDLSDEEFDVLYDLMDEVYPADESILSVEP
jgi:hypothetical protein